MIVFILFVLVICMGGVVAGRVRHSRTCLKCPFLRRFWSDGSYIYLCTRFVKVVDKPGLFVSCEVEVK